MEFRRRAQHRMKPFASVLVVFAAIALTMGKCACRDQAEKHKK